MTSPSVRRPPGRRIRLLWMALGLLVAAALTGVAGGLGVARLQDPAAADLAQWAPPEQSAAASPVTRPTVRPGASPCVPVFDIYNAMNHAYWDGADFTETRLAAAEQLRQLADQYTEPDRTSVLTFADVLAADGAISDDDRDAVLEAIDRGGDAWLAFNDRTC